MSEKRYFKVEYDEEWYLFDSTTISEQLVKEQAEYGYGVFANSLSPSEVVDLLNELNDENQLLKCALALDAITNISLNDKKVDIPPYYEFENYQQLKKERREEYDEYW